MNNHPENQNLSGREASASESKFKKKKIVTFGESILGGIRFREFNYWLYKGYVQLVTYLKNFFSMWNH